MVEAPGIEAGGSTSRNVANGRETSRRRGDRRDVSRRNTTCDCETSDATRSFHRAPRRARETPRARRRPRGGARCIRCPLSAATGERDRRGRCGFRQRGGAVRPCSQHGVARPRRGCTSRARLAQSGQRARSPDRCSQPAASSAFSASSREEASGSVTRQPPQVIDPRAPTRDSMATCESASCH